MQIEEYQHVFHVAINAKYIVLVLGDEFNQEDKVHVFDSITGLRIDEHPVNLL